MHSSVAIFNEVENLDNFYWPLLDEQYKSSDAGED